jgi:hypothetical protein
VARRAPKRQDEELAFTAFGAPQGIESELRARAVAQHWELEHGPDLRGRADGFSTSWRAAIAVVMRMSSVRRRRIVRSLRIGGTVMRNRVDLRVAFVRAAGEEDDARGADPGRDA